MSEALVVTALYYLVRHLTGSWQQIAPSLEQLRFGYVVGAFSLTLVMSLLVSLGWTLAMRWVSVSLSVRDGFAIYYQSSILRYLPGSLWYLPGRAYLCQQRGIPFVLSARGMGLELFVLLANAGALGGAALAAQFNSAWLSVLSVVCLVSMGVACLKPSWLRRLVLRERSPDDGQRASLAAISVVYLFAWLMYGVSMYLLFPALRLPVETSIGGFAYVVSASIASWLAGFVSPVPLGLGIREVVLANLFGPIGIADSIVLLSLLQRAIEILVEAGLWVAALWLGRSGGRDNP
jgi:uncharacterized membrane protein YbhN (UPF0104 family)